MKPETRVIHAPVIDIPDDSRPLNFPVYQNVKWEADTVEDALGILRGQRPGYFYSRVSNPTVHQLETVLASLQGREQCLATASGVNAVAQSLLALCRAGDHVLFFVEGYGPTRAIIRNLLARYGVTHSMISIEDHAGIERELSARPTRLVFFESPTNPVNKIADIEAIVTLAHQYGALAVLDNTAAGFHQHGEYAIDVFVHSLTKFTTGAGDVMGGAVIANRDIIAGMKADFSILGAQLDPLSASLMLRGMKSYFLRYRAQSESATRIAEFLASHPACSKVRYPGFGAGEQATLARKQMRDMGCVVAFDVRAGFEAGRRFAETLQLFAKTPSFGSAESLVVAPQMMQPKEFTEPQRRDSDIGEGTVRLSIGLESVEDLIADLDQALR